MLKHHSLYVLLLLITLSSCGSYFNQPLSQQDARLGEVTSHTTTLTQFPEPAEPVVAGVYNFKDQTGQYKNVENGSTFSTAVSQGATTMLIKALEDSKWFTPIERENLGNLLNERNIIRSTRDEYRKNNNPNEPNLPPLLYAGVLLEGGIISYDSNIITGGLGARYFGVGGSTQYRQDRLTVYLRAVSTSSGRVLKTVYVSKTILSQAIDASLFRYVNFQRLLEVETGYTKNEPVQLAMKDAIEKAVESLIIEGIKDNLWSSKEGVTVNEALIENYEKEKELEESTRLYERAFFTQEFKQSIVLSFAGALLDGDYGNKQFAPLGGLGYTSSLNEFLAINVNANLFKLYGGSDFSESYGSANLNLEFRILKNDKLSPVVYGGGGLVTRLQGSEQTGSEDLTAAKVQYGLAVDYQLAPRFSMRLFAEHNLTFTDELEAAVSGKRDDYYYNVGLGLKYHFNFSNSSDKENTSIE